MEEDDDEEDAIPIREAIGGPCRAGSSGCSKTVETDSTH